MRHTRGDYAGRTPVGPEPEHVATPFGVAIVYANEAGNVVAQTADPEAPLVNGGYGFDIAYELCWDGSGTLTGPHRPVFGPNGRVMGNYHDYDAPVSAALAALALPYAEKHEQALVELAVEDVKRRIDRTHKAACEVIAKVEELADARYMAPVYYDLPIGRVKVGFQTGQSFKVEGAGFGGTCVVEGRPVFYTAILGTDAGWRGGEPFVTLGEISGGEKGHFVGPEHKAMLEALGEELRARFPLEIAQAQAYDARREAQRELDRANDALLFLGETLERLEARQDELGAEAGPRP